MLCTVMQINKIGLIMFLFAENIKITLSPDMNNSKRQNESLEQQILGLTISLVLIHTEFLVLST